MIRSLYLRRACVLTLGPIAVAVVYLSALRHQLGMAFRLARYQSRQEIKSLREGWRR